MKEKIKKIMYGGGFSLIIAIICMTLYLFIMDKAKSCSDENIEPVEIKLDENGNLYLHYIYDDKDELMVLWETDGGTIKPVTENKDLSEQYTENNKWYYAYGTVDDKFMWDENDSDGNQYEIATVRAILYEKTEGKSIYYIRESAVEVQFTLTKENGKLKKLDDRYFSNPVRKGTDKNWTQIYLINESEEINTYRYRSGKDIPDNEYLFMRWEADGEILSETDVHNGLIPKCGILNSNKNKNRLTQINTMSIKKSILEKEEYNISAYIIEETHYEDDKVKDEYKINEAKMKINK